MVPEKDASRRSPDQLSKMGVQPWVMYFLNNEGRNPDLAKGIEYHARYFVGPVNLPLTNLHRIAGPEQNMLYKVNENDWEQAIATDVNHLRAGLSFPPLIAVDFVDTGLAIADGNKRYEALKRFGVERSNTILCLKYDPRVYNLYSI